MLFKSINLVMTATAVAALVACGGGGGGTGGGTVSSAVPLTGSVSQGAPIVGATITLTDVNGTVLSGGVSGSDGSYSVPDISALKAPIMVSASATVGGSPVTYRSLLAIKGGQNTANVTPITDAILVQSTGKSGALIERAASTELGNIDLTKVGATTTKFVTAISNVLNQISAGAASTFNPFTTKFIADGESAADKVNDLVRFTTNITPTGVNTDITDKSNNVGTVTIVDNGASTALDAIPSVVLGINPKYLTALITSLNAATATATNIDSILLDNVFDDKYLNHGKTKAEMLNDFRVTNRATLLGATFSNHKILSCNSNNFCEIQFTIRKINNSIETFSMWVKYYPSLNKFYFYGDQSIFNAGYNAYPFKFVNISGASESYGVMMTFNVGTLESLGYQSASLIFQSGISSPDTIYNFISKVGCDSVTLGQSYAGIPNDDSTSSCNHYINFNTSADSLFSIINGKIRQGNYFAKFQAWKNLTRTGTPDEFVIAVTEPLPTSTSLGGDAYPRVQIVQNLTGLPYLSIANSDDFVVSGDLCISSSTFCSPASPQPHTTVFRNSIGKLPSTIAVNSADGWQVGEKANSYAVSVKDKAGRYFSVAGGF